MFENLTANGVHYSRYIMSWVRVGGTINKTGGNSDFNNWLESLELTTEDIDNIMRLATNGKMELETSARRWILQKEELES